jgi:hypothetical protein
VQVGGHHLVGLADLDHVVDARELVEGDRLEPLGVADEADDRVDRAPRDERLAAGGSDAFGDRLDVGLGGLALHDHDHRVPSPPLCLPERPTRRSSRFL